MAKRMEGGNEAVAFCSLIERLKLDGAIEGKRQREGAVNINRDLHDPVDPQEVWDLLGRFDDRLRTEHALHEAKAALLLLDMAGVTHPPGMGQQTIVDIGAWHVRSAAWVNEHAVELREVRASVSAAGSLQRTVESAMHKLDARAAGKATAQPNLDMTGPMKTLDAVCVAILHSKGDGQVLAEGDAVEHKAVKACLSDPNDQKPSDYLAPSGRLCTGGWIRREGTSVILTDKGARDGNSRLKHQAAKRSQAGGR